MNPESPLSTSLLAVARGEEPADLLLHGGRVVNVFTGELIRADVAIHNGWIAGVGTGYGRARTTLDVTGRYIAPGFIDGHIHIESSMLPLHEFGRLCLLRGTTAVVCDPHEIANVLGIRGIDYMLRASENLPIDVFLMAPSCVPATSMESAGARIGPRDLGRLLKHERVLGLAEMMNFPGAIHGDAGVLAKLAATHKAGKISDGHAPGLRNQSLQAYAAAGIGSDHECVSAEEAIDKLRAGLRLMIREGSAARNLADLLPVVTDTNRRRCLFVTDDKHPGDLLHDGHLDATLRKAVRHGLNPVAAIQMVTLNPAEYFGLTERGAVAPGKRADLVVLRSLNQFQVESVFKNGRRMVHQNRLLTRMKPVRDPTVRDTVHPGDLNRDRLRIPANGGRCRVIEIVPDQIVTRQRIEQPTLSHGEVVADPDRDLLKLAVIERHRATGRTGLGLVSGFGLRQGALGTTVAHDSHNIILVGVSDEDMLLAARELQRFGGGMVAVAHGKVAARLQLPIAGLMADAPAATVAAGLDRLLKTARAWGSPMPNPFATLSFLALPVIPELKLTDRGLVDVGRFQLVDLFF